MNVTLSGTGESHLGGMSCDAYLTSTISFNTNNGNLKATLRVSGIAAHANNASSATIQNNTNYGNITTTITDSANTGGIIGYLNASATATIENNTNYGTITSNSSTRPACGIASGDKQNTVFTHSAVKDRRPAAN